MTAGSVMVPRIIPIRVPLPGMVKNHIDTTTPVEIKSDTLDVTIYYTLDGSKPEAVKRPGLLDNSTLQYKEPICLPKGKVYLKALAVTSDGRASTVVTKLFFVDHVLSNEPPPDREKEGAFMKGSGQSLSDQNTSMRSVLANWTQGTESAWEDATTQHQVVKVQGVSHLKSSVSPLFRKSTSPKQQSAFSTTFGPAQKNKLLEGLPQKRLTTTQISRIQRETDFLRCAQCLSPRPSDPFARFCLHCGAPVPPIPGQRLPPTEGAQMGSCIHCKSLVPVNTHTCVVCEAPISPQLQPQASVRLQEKVICHSCGTANPAHIENCVTCETKLLEHESTVLTDQAATPQLGARGKMVSCSKCSRVNTSDARFCDWCGSRPSHLTGYLTCTRCGASSHPYANFCGSCGVFLEGPPRLQSQTGLAHSQDGASELEQMPSLHSDNPTWQLIAQSSAPTLPAAPSLTHVSQQTQTVGLFYPSGSELEKKVQREVREGARQEQMRDRRPLLTAVSPGRGYWRKQLDHICAHLRSYAQNNPEFRTLIGEPRMGKMISAVVEEDRYEVSLRISFTSVAPDAAKEAFVEKSLGVSAGLLSSVTEGGHGLSGSQNSPTGSENGAVTTSALARKKRSPRRKALFEENGVEPPSKNEQLLREVGPQGKGQISLVEQLLDEGADPSCRDSEGRPALTVAVVNQHHDVIPLLVQKGADVDQQSGPLNNTALHEAATRGTEGVRCAETLLGCNASIRRKNDRGLTVHDLAVQSGCSSLISLITARMGQDLLGKLSRPRKGTNLDVF